MKKHSRMIAVYCPNCGAEALARYEEATTYICGGCLEEMRFERLPRIVLRKRIKEAARNCNSKAARG